MTTANEAKLYEEAATTELERLSQRGRGIVMAFINALKREVRRVGEELDARDTTIVDLRDEVSRLRHEARDPSSLPARMMSAMETMLVDLIRKGDWLTIDYGAKVKLGTEAFRGVYDNLDHARIRSLVKERAEEQVADKLLASLATELATDVKLVMSNRDLRERARAMLREHIEAATR